jgi:hypothetical protein
VASAAFNETSAANGAYQLVHGDGQGSQMLAFSAPPSAFLKLDGLADFKGALSTALVAGAPVVKDLSIAFDPTRAMIGVKPSKP